MKSIAVVSAIALMLFVRAASAQGFFAPISRNANTSGPSSGKLDESAVANFNVVKVMESR